MASKYIIIKTPEGERAIIFPSPPFFHDEMSSAFGSDEVISAGFVKLDKDGKFKCYGESEGLKISSRGEDDEIVMHHQLKANSARR